MIGFGKTGPAGAVTTAIATGASCPGAGRPPYLSLSAWARARGRSFERARKVCLFGYVEGAIPYTNARGNTSFIVPADAAWPTLDRRSQGPIPPPGFLMIRDWAKALGKSYDTARVHLRLGHIPEAIHFGPASYHRAVPADLPWPARSTGRPRIHPIPQGAPSGCSQGASESRGGRPALQETP